MLTISDSMKVALEIENITSIQEAFEGNTLRCVYCAVRSVYVCVCMYVCVWVTAFGELGGAWGGAVKDSDSCF